MRSQTCLRLSFGACLIALSATVAAQNAVTTGPASVYAGPDDSYPVVAQLDVDAPVRVNGCINDWSWCDVSFEDSRGWLYAPSISYDYDGGYVPMYQYAPSFGIPIVEFSIGTYWDRYYHERPWYAQRDQWMRREPTHHQRPSGPPPSSTPPPRQMRADRAQEGHPERPLRLGHAEPGRPAPPERERSAPPERERSAAPLRENRPNPPERVAPPPQEHSAPPRQAEPARHEEPRREQGARHEEKPGDHPGDSPH